MAIKETSDLALIKQLEKETGKRFEDFCNTENTAILDVDTGDRIGSGYYLDEGNNVVSLNIHLIENETLPSIILKIKQLSTLSFYRTKLRDFSILAEITGLHTLIIAKNLLRDTSGVAQLTNLTSLSLAGNQLSDVSGLAQLKRLKNLDLRGNKIKSLPQSFLDLDMEINVDKKYGFDGIALYGNPLENPPVEIIRQGKDAIRSYFQSLKGQEEQWPLNEVKVLLVGEGAAGKTSLVKRLLDLPFRKDESQTHGININKWIISAHDQNITAHLWDFGGQEIMHATHQFFLSRRSLYILVLDGRKDEKTEYWLNHIKTFGGDSPVMVVINKIDQNPGFDLNRRFLQQKYPNIKGFYRISCAKDQGLKKFKKGLEQQLAAVELIGTIWAESWFNVKEHLEKMEDHFIDAPTYQQICKDAGVEDEKQQETLVDFLNDLGVILHFKDFHLEETHVLEPRWITSAVYKIINSEILSDDKGILDLCNLGTILKAQGKEESGYSFPPRMYKYIFQLMKKFELCFSIDDQTILVPDLLAVGEPAFDFDYDRALKFRLEYEFLPPSVMPRFIVRRHTDIKDNLSWRTGVVLMDKTFDAEALVKSDNEKKTIDIYVNGTQKRDYFAVILKTFREINSSFQQIEIDETVPLPDNSAVSVGYLHLVRLETMGTHEFLPDKATKTYNVKALLEGIKPESQRQKEIDQLMREGKLEINIIQNQSNEQTALQLQKSEVNVDVDVNVEVNLSVELPAIRDDFYNLRGLLESKNPQLSGSLKEIMDSLDETTPDSSQEKLSKPMNKLGRFLRTLGDENSNRYKLLKGISNGLETAKKVAKSYNKFAQWIPGLPVVPESLLKD